MKTLSLRASALALIASCCATLAVAAPARYTIDSEHTYPSFTTDHMGGLSTFQGKFNGTKGSIVLDREAQTGTLEVQIDTASIDFGHEELNKHVKSAEILDVQKYPQAVYSGKLGNFRNGAPTEVDGTLTLHGVTRPLKLKITSFMCKQHPMKNKEVCGANATGTLDREQFGIAIGKNMGFKMDVGLQIQVEALKD